MDKNVLAPEKKRRGKKSTKKNIVSTQKIPTKMTEENIPTQPASGISLVQDGDSLKRSSYDRKDIDNDSQGSLKKSLNS